jgi:4-amino-4-deoxy-L-arabinose transferase-like glycosyltransferase
MKVILSSLFFKTLGVNPVSYNLLGYLVGIAGIWAGYQLVNQLFNGQSAKISSLMLATSPLFLSISIFSLRDYLLTCFMLLTLHFYSIGSSLYLVFSAFSFLSKESGFLLIISIIFVEIISFVKTHKFNQLLLSGLGLVVPFFWWEFLKTNHQQPWSDWIFSETASRGTYYTMMNNIFTLKIFNHYAYQHWLHLFVLNFNWFFWLIIIIGASLVAIAQQKKALSWLFGLNLSQKQKTVLVILIFCLGYFFTALCLQTYTIPRYVLPISAFMYIFAGYFLSQILKIAKRKVIRIPVVIGVCFIIFESLFSSVDFFSVKIWGRTRILGQTFYDLHGHSSGNDGLTYNLQYLSIARKRTDEIMKANKKGAHVISDQCAWIYPDPNNDFKTRDLLTPMIDIKQSCLEK